MIEKMWSRPKYTDLCFPDDNSNLTSEILKIL